MKNATFERMSDNIIGEVLWLQRCNTIALTLIRTILIISKEESKSKQEKREAKDVT